MSYEYPFYFVIRPFVPLITQLFMLPCPDCQDGQAINYSPTDVRKFLISPLFLINIKNNTDKANKTPHFCKALNLNWFAENIIYTETV